jgi:hypothetical protein
LSIEGVEGMQTFNNLIYIKPFMPHTWELLFESSHPQIRGGSWKLLFESSRAILSCNSRFWNVVCDTHMDRQTDTTFVIIYRIFWNFILTVL